jgi:polyhydroxyalkanoate synthesis regulator phasin
MGTKEVHEKNAKIIDELIYRIESIEKIYQPALEAAFTRVENLEREVAKLKSEGVP